MTILALLLYRVEVLTNSLFVVAMGVFLVRYLYSLATMTRLRFSHLALRAVKCVLFGCAFLACLVVVYATGPYPPDDMSMGTRISYVWNVIGPEDRMENTRIVYIMIIICRFTVLTGPILLGSGVIYVVCDVAKRIMIRSINQAE
jgi:hypothetical protein